MLSINALLLVGQVWCSETISLAGAVQWGAMTGATWSQLCTFSSAGSVQVDREVVSTYASAGQALASSLQIVSVALSWPTPALRHLAPIGHSVETQPGASRNRQCVCPCRAKEKNVCHLLMKGHPCLQATLCFIRSFGGAVQLIRRVMCFVCCWERKGARRVLFGTW